jgi:hypothetical protein
MQAFVVAVVALATVAIPTVARADGGAYFSLNETYYVAGDPAVATTYVAIPKSKRSELDRGPFYAYLADDGTWIRPERSLPASAVRVGTFDVHEEHGSFEFETRFIVPAISSGWHTLQLCNAPCTITGFRESLTGSFYVVQTRREADLMIENGKLRGQLAGTRRDEAKAERALDEARQEASTQAHVASAAQQEVGALRQQLAAAHGDADAVRVRAADERRLAIALIVVVLVGSIVLLRARKQRVVPSGEVVG